METDTESGVHGVHPTLHSRIIPIGTVDYHPENPRDEHDIPGIRESLRENGQYRPIVVQESTRYVLAGNGTLEAAREEGWTHIAADFLHVGDAVAKRITIADNRLSEKGKTNADKLVAFLQGMDQLEGTGYTLDDVENLVATLDKIPEVQYEPFRGGYSETPEETDARAANAPPTVDPIRQVILAFKSTEGQQRFLDDVKVIQHSWGVETVTGAVTEAVHRTAEHYREVHQQPQDEMGG